MAYDGRVLALARAAIAAKKQNNENEVSRRRSEIREKLPEISKLEAEVSLLMSGVALTALKSGSDAGQAVRNAKEQSQAILAKQSQLLLENGYPEDYLDDIYTCSKCRDTGYAGGAACSCLLDEYRREQARLLSSMLNFNGQGFEKFDLNLYEAGSAGETTSAVRSKMGDVFELCKDYAVRFGKNSVNLLFQGETGLGKTFLSASIAKVVSEKGYSVVYDTAVSVMDAFEAQKFDRWGEGTLENSSQIKRYLSCNLLILDDLGTEMTTAFTQSALYTLINTRLVSGLKTIISTNLKDDELARRYTPQIVSRLKGEYIPLRFCGRDIREVKYDRGI